MQVTISKTTIKNLTLALGVLILAILGIWLISSRPASQETPANDLPQAEAQADGTQVVQVTAKVGYSPAVTVAKADTPTKLKVVTNNTYDCSIALTVPAIGYRGMLPYSGTTEIDIPPQKAGTEIQGVCTMGMYRFQIKFI